MKFLFLGHLHPAILIKDNIRKEKYGEALNLIEEAYKNSEKYNNAVQYLYETMIGGTEVVRFAMKGGQLNHLLNNSPDSTNLINAGVEKLKAQAKDFFKDYSVTTDKKVFVALINMYYQDVPKESEKLSNNLTHLTSPDATISKKFVFIEPYYGRCSYCGEMKELRWKDEEGNHLCDECKKEEESR